MLGCLKQRPHCARSINLDVTALAPNMSKAGVVGEDKAPAQSAAEKKNMLKVGVVGENDIKYKKSTLAAIIAAGGKNMPNEGVVGENDNNEAPAQGVADKKNMAKMDVVGDNNKKNKNKISADFSFRSYGAFRVALLSNLEAGPPGAPRQSPQAHDTLGPTSIYTPTIATSQPRSTHCGTMAGPTPKTTPTSSTSSGICAAVSCTRALLNQTPSTSSGLRAAMSSTRALLDQTPSTSSGVARTKTSTPAHWEFDGPSMRGMSKLEMSRELSVRGNSSKSDFWSEQRNSGKFELLRGTSPDRETSTDPLRDANDA